MNHSVDNDNPLLGDQEQVHGGAGLLWLHQLRERPRGPYGHAQAQRQDHTQ